MQKYFPLIQEEIEDLVENMAVSSNDRAEDNSNFGGRKSLTKGRNLDINMEPEGIAGCKVDSLRINRHTKQTNYKFRLDFSETITQICFELRLSSQH